METDAAGGKTKNSFSTAACKTLLGFAQFPQARRRLIKQQNRTDHLLQKPDIFICYRQPVSEQCVVNT
jgi:hypothetical protein